jgi:hypothetical protein
VRGRFAGTLGTRHALLSLQKCAIKRFGTRIPYISPDSRREAKSILKGI